MPICPFTLHSLVYSSLSLLHFVPHITLTHTLKTTSLSSQVSFNALMKKSQCFHERSIYSSIIFIDFQRYASIIVMNGANHFSNQTLQLFHTVMLHSPTIMTSMMMIIIIITTTTMRWVCNVKKKRKSARDKWSQWKSKYWKIQWSDRWFTNEKKTATE